MYDRDYGYDDLDNYNYDDFNEKSNYQSSIVIDAWEDFTPKDNCPTPPLCGNRSKCLGGCKLFSRQTPLEASRSYTEDDIPTRGYDY